MNLSKRNTFGRLWDGSIPFLRRIKRDYVWSRPLLRSGEWRSLRPLRPDLQCSTPTKTSLQRQPPSAILTLKKRGNSLDKGNYSLPIMADLARDPLRPKSFRCSRLKYSLRLKFQNTSKNYLHVTSTSGSLSTRLMVTTSSYVEFSTRSEIYSLF